MSRYAQAHEKPNGPGDARPTAMQIVEDEDLVGKLTDKVFLVTGVSSGIGIETMAALYATGGHVFGTVRNMQKGKPNSSTFKNLSEYQSDLENEQVRKPSTKSKARPKAAKSRSLRWISRVWSP